MFVFHFLLFLALTGTLLLVRFERAVKTRALAKETLKDLIPGTFEGNEYVLIQNRILWSLPYKYTGDVLEHKWRASLKLHYC